MKPIHLSALVILLLAGCGHFGAIEQSKGSLADARKGFTTRIVKRERTREPVDEPPPGGAFRKVSYTSRAGQLPAYLSLDPNDGKRRPAIVWITGGDSNSIGDVWSESPPDNDQSASAYRKAGIVMMFPSLRGGNDNPGIKESFLGEVDDILAAREYLAKQPYVDPARIYLGGHSTGGTLVLLTAECSDKFRAVFSFGPVADVSDYGGQYVTCDPGNPREIELRSPGHWLASIKTPVFVFEGAEQGNVSSLRAMSRASTNPQAHFLPVEGATHFSILAPTNQLIAQKILRDTGPSVSLTFTEDEVNRSFAR